MTKDNFIYRLTRKTLPFLLAASLYAPSSSFSAKDRIELPEHYHVVKDNLTNKPINFDIYYSGEKFNVRMVETQKRGEGVWRPWMIEGKHDGQKYIVGRTDDNLTRFYGMPEQEFYSRLAMTATVAYLDEKSSYNKILRDLAKEFREIAQGNIYFNSGREVFDIASISGGILASKAVLKSNPGAWILAGKTMKKTITKYFIDRSTLPDDAKSGLSTVGNLADFIKKRIVDKNTTRLFLYADDLDRCVNILEAHDLSPYTREADWDYASAKQFYTLFSKAQPEGVALSGFLRKSRMIQTSFDALAQRLLKKTFEGITGVSYEDVVEVGASVKEIFDYTPVKKGLDEITVITRRNNKEFLLYFESRFDVTPGRSSDANTFLNADWGSDFDELPEEIGEEEPIVLEDQVIPRAFPPPKVFEAQDLETKTSESPQSPPRESLGKRNVLVYDYSPKPIEASSDGKFIFNIRNDNDFSIKRVDITNIEINPSNGLTLEATVSTENSGGWGGAGLASVKDPIDVLGPKQEGEIKMHYRAGGPGECQILYQLIFNIGGDEQITKQRKLEIEVKESQ